MTNTNTNIKHLQWLGGIDDDLILRAERARAKRPARVNLKLISVAAAVLALAVLASAFVPGLINKPEQPPVLTDAPTDAPIVTETPETSIFDNPNIIFGGGGGNEGDRIKWNHIYISDSLQYTFNHNNDNKLIAVTLYILPNSEFTIDGKTTKYYTDNVRAAVKALKAAKALIKSGDFWESALNDPEMYQDFMHRYGEDVYKRCFEEGTHAFIKEEADAIRKEAVNKLYIAYDEENAFLRKYYDTILPLSDFTDKLDNLNIPYMFIDREDTSHGEDDPDDTINVPVSSMESYVPGKDIVLLVTAESLSKLNIDDITDHQKRIIFIRYGPPIQDY